MLRQLVEDYVNPKVSNCLPTSQLITKVLTALAEDVDINSSLRLSTTNTMKRDSFNDQLAVVSRQVGLDKGQVVSYIRVAVFY